MMASVHDSDNDAIFGKNLSVYGGKAACSRPLWEVIEGCGVFGQIPVLLRRRLIAVLICSVRDWLVPEEQEPEEPVGYGIGADCGEFTDQWARWHDRQRLRALLTAEADRAERGKKQ